LTDLEAQAEQRRAEVVEALLARKTSAVSVWEENEGDGQNAHLR